MSYAKDVARKHVNGFSLGGGAFAIIPIPGVHSAGLTAAEIKMATDIARIYGIKPNGIVWKIILKVIMLKLGGSALLKGVGEALTFIPIIGWAAKSIVAGSAIKGFGEILIAYFEDKFPYQQAYRKPSLESMISVFGNSVTRSELHDYWYSYDDTR